MLNFKGKGKKKDESEKKYILVVTRKSDDGIYSSEHYGWSRDLKFTYDEALKEKEKIRNKYLSVKIVKPEVMTLDNVWKETFKNK